MKQNLKLVMIMTFKLGVTHSRIHAVVRGSCSVKFTESISVSLIVSMFNLFKGRRKGLSVVFFVLTLPYLQGQGSYGK
jgi:hypothetical protein